MTLPDPRPPGVLSAADVHVDSRRDRPAYLRALAEQHGDVVSLGDRAWLVNDPRSARDVLAQTGSRFTTLTDFLGRAVPAARYGDHHADALAGVHRLVGSRATGPGLRGLQESITAVLPGSAAELDLVRTGRLLGVETATHASLGMSEPGVAEASVRLLDALLPKLSSPWLLPGWWPSPRRLRLNRADARLTAAIDRSGAGRPAGSVLGFLAGRSPEQEAESTPTLPWLKKLLLASQEPTGAAPAWTAHRLLAEPDWLDRVSAEVIAVDPLGAGTVDPLRQLPVTTAVVLETLRIRTPTWLVGRRAVGEIELGGYRAAPGQLVYLSPWLLHQRDDLYPDPHRFDPARWLDPARRRAAHRGYFTFSRGPHSCPGRRPSVALTVCLVGALVRGYDLRAAGDVIADTRRSMLPSGLRLHVVPRGGAAG